MYMSCAFEQIAQSTDHAALLANCAALLMNRQITAVERSSSVGMQHQSSFR